MAEKTEHFFLERYDFSCPKCKHEMQAAPSMSMTEFGMNSGHGTCSKCKAFLRLTIHPDIRGKVMVAQPWEEFLKNAEKTCLTS